MFTRTLSKQAQNALALLGKSEVVKDAYLAGGSALALHFGHRYSFDFDFFSKRPPEAQSVVKKLSTLGTFKTQMTDKKTILGTFNTIKFSLFHYDYPLIANFHSFLQVNIADPADIAAMKVVAIVDRGIKRDFVDLYFLAQHGYSIEKIFKLYDKKYGKLANNMYTILTALRYFEEAEPSEMPQMTTKVSWEEVKQFFEKEAIRLGKLYL